MTTVSAADVDELAALECVAQIFPSLSYRPLSLDGMDTHRWDRVLDFGIRGNDAIGGDVKVAIVDNGGIAPHAALQVVDAFNTANPNYSVHATALAGIVGSRNAGYPGYARGVELYSANATTPVDVDLITAAEWAKGQNCDIFLMALGHDTGGQTGMLDNYCDYVTRTSYATFVVAAGNEPATHQVDSPAIAYSVLAVGNVSDAGDNDWANDSMHPSSAWVDPLSLNQDREEPDMAAVGTSIVTTDPNGGYTTVLTGTSAAAAAVTGMAAALTQVNPVLKSWPEAVRAVMMATAWHNVEGATPRSEKEGAGTAHGLAAFNCAKQTHFFVGNLTPSSFTSTGYHVTNMFLRGGDRTRVAIAWDSSASGGPWFASNVLNADLDLAILAGNAVTTGPTLASSASYDNSFEIVEFVPPTTGFYTIRINDYRFDGTSEFIAGAWSQAGDARSVELREDLPDVLGNDASGFVIGNPAFRMSPKDAANPYGACIVYASVGDQYGYPLADGRLVYGDFDALTTFSLDPANGYFFGGFGAYDANGEYAGNFLSIPELAPYVGYSIYFTAVTVEAGAPASIDGISETKKATLGGHAVNLNLADNGWANVALPFAFPYFGSVRTNVYINANGNLSFGSANSTATEGLLALSNFDPIIAALWDDLDPSAGGVVRYRGNAQEFVVEWIDVPQKNSGDANSVRVVLRAGGEIEFQYLECSLIDCVVGISPGGSATVDTVDITDGWFRAQPGHGVAESFYGGFIFQNPLDLDTSPTAAGIADRNTVRFTPSGANASGGYLMTVDL